MTLSGKVLQTYLRAENSSDYKTAAEAEAARQIADKCFFDCALHGLQTSWPPFPGRARVIMLCYCFLANTW